MFDFQTSAIFPTHAVGAPGPLPKSAERWRLAAGKDELHGVHIPPARAAKRKVLLLGFAGNAWNSQDAAGYLHLLYPAAHIVVFHYRGYAPSTGRPSAEALVADAPMVHDLAVERIAPEATVAVGFSIGTGVAAQLARARPLDGLILVTPFDSLQATASDLYPMLPMSLLFRHQMDSKEALTELDVPVAILAAGRDQLIRPARTDALRRAVRNLVYDETIERAGHNDIYERSDFQRSMGEALSVILAGAAPRA